MSRRNIWVLLLAAAAVFGGSGIAAAQDGSQATNETAGMDGGMATGEASEGMADHGAGHDGYTGGAGYGYSGVGHGYSGYGGGYVAPSTCGSGVTGTDSLGAISDLNTRDTRSQVRDQDVDIDERNVLLGIALHNNGANGIDFNSLRDIDTVESRRVSARQSSDLDRNDVFSALALGLTSHASALDALGCVSDLSADVTQTARASRTVDLEENDVLLAIALSNSAGSPLELNDIASIREAQSQSTSRDQRVDVDRDDTFLALALGAGGTR